jgi:hypothetical protein
MSCLLATPEMLAAAASEVADISSSLSAANAAATASTTGVIAAAGDEVSAAIASLFSSHGRQYQALSAEAVTFHAQFVRALSGAGGAYAAAEAANVSPLQTVEQDVLGVVNAPTELLLGRPLIGTGGKAGTADRSGRRCRRDLMGQRR